MRTSGNHSGKPLIGAGRTSCWSAMSVLSLSTGMRGRWSHLVGCLDAEQFHAECQRSGGQVTQRQSAAPHGVFLGFEYGAGVVEAGEGAREVVQVLGEAVELEAVADVGDDGSEGDQFQGE